jgi:hypothetical protein
MADFIPPTRLSPSAFGAVVTDIALGETAMKLSIFAICLTVGAAGGSQLMTRSGSPAVSHAKTGSPTVSHARQSTQQVYDTFVCDLLARSDADSVVREWFGCRQ